MPTLNVSLERQEDTNLCWAAVSLAILNHYRKYNHGFPSSQQELVAEFTNGRNEQLDVFDVLDFYQVSNGSRPGFRQAEIIESIDNDEPAVIKTGTGNSGHFLLVIGYRKHPIEGFQLELRDPSDPLTSIFLKPNQVPKGLQGVLFTKIPPIPVTSSARRCPCPCVIM
jgi:hypothetical protein